MKGLLARLLEANMSIETLRTLDVLQYNDWELLDQEVMQVARQRLVAAADLLDRNLTFPVADAMGVPILHWQVGSDMNPAQVDMDPATRTQNDRQTFSSKYLPLPIVHKEFQLSPRVLAASRRMGHPLDVSNATLAGEIVAEGVDNIIVNGTNITHGGGTVYGYTTLPQRAVGNLTGVWTGLTGSQILTDVLAMIAALKAKRRFGPYGIYVPATYETKLEEDFKTNVMGSIRERLEMIRGVEFVKPLDSLADGNVVVVQLTKSSVELIDGIQPTTVSWEEQGGKVLMFEVMAIMVPRLRADAAGNSGIAHYTEP